MARQCQVQSITQLSNAITVKFPSYHCQCNTPIGEKWNECFEYKDAAGVMIHQKLKEMPCTYAIGSRATENVDISRSLKFDPLGSGIEFWKSLESTGKLDAEPKRETPKTCNFLTDSTDTRFSFIFIYLSSILLNSMQSRILPVAFVLQHESKMMMHGVLNSV